MLLLIVTLVVTRIIRVYILHIYPRNCLALHISTVHRSDPLFRMGLTLGANKGEGCGDRWGEEVVKK